MAAPLLGPRAASTIRFDLSADPANLDPLFATTDASGVAQTLARLAFEPFFDLDANGRPVPALLSRVPSVENGDLSSDGRTIVYHLRKGVLWSDGVPVGANDVLFTLHALLDPNVPVASRDGYDLIDRAVALDPLTVRLHLRRAWAPAVSTFFASGVTPQFVLPEHVLAHQTPLRTAAFNGAPTVGDGPFSFVSWKRGERLVYARNPRYWRGAAKVAKLELAIVPDPSTNLTLLQSGAIDFNLIAPSQRAVLGANPDLAYVSVPTALIAGVALQTQHPPLDDPRVRRALAAAIDRASISAKITLGAYPVADTDRPRFSFAYDATIREPAYAPAAADRALDAAGWRRGPDGIRIKNGARLALTYVQFPESTTGVRTATVVQRELHDRGIDITLKSVSNAQLFLPAADGGLLAKGAFDLAYVPWPMGADPDDRFLLGCQGASKNYMRYCDRRVDALETTAAADPVVARRRDAYRAIDRIVARDVPIVYLFGPRYLYAVRKHLHGFAPNAFSPTWNAYDWSVR